THDAIRGAVDFYAAQGKIEQAQKILDRIPETKPRPGAAELILAGFNEHYVSLDAARKYYLAATTTAPSTPAVWRQLAAFDLRTGHYDDARQAIEQGLANVPDDVLLKRLRAVTSSVTQILSRNPQWRGVLAVLAAAAPEDRGTSDFLTAANDPASQPTADTMPSRLADAANRFPRSLALRSALVQWHVARREFEQAGKVAHQTMEAFPNDAESARVTATVYRAAGQWELAAAAAQKWRQRASNNPAPADLMLADIRLSQGDATAA